MTPALWAEVYRREREPRGAILQRAVTATSFANSGPDSARRRRLRAGAVPLVVRESGRRRRGGDARSGAGLRLARDRLRDRAEAAPRGRDRRAVEVRLPRVRRRGRLEPRAAAARVPVLRNRVRGEAGHRGGDRRARTRRRRCCGAATTPSGWQADKREVKCRSCNAISVLDPSRQAQNCEFCGSAQLVPYTEDKAAQRPESVLPFKVSEADARDRIRAWYGKLWLAPSALAKKALTDTVRGIYLPYWTFDARVEAEWTAEAGHYYYTTETYEQNGRTETRQVQHIRWEPAAGRLQHFFDDDLVCASVGIHPDLLRGIEPFPTADLEPYDAGFVAGWIVERYQIDLARRGPARARRHGRETAGAVRAADSGRHVPQPRRARRLFGADVQAHPRARLVPFLHVRSPRVPVRDERRQRHDPRRVPEEPVEGRARSCSRS